MSRKTTVMVSTTLRSIGVLTLITSILWTTLGIYHAFVKPPEIDVEPEILAPINPSLDEETLQNLQQRRQLTNDPTSQEIIAKAAEILQVQPTSTPTTVRPQETSEATPSANIELDTPDATQSAAL